MFGRFFILLALVLCSCAQPKYAAKPLVAASASKQSQDCAANFSKLNACVLWSWQKQPTSPDDEGVLDFKIVRANKLDGSLMPVDLSETVDLVLWMDSMGHGSSPVTITKIDTGSYRANELYFSMGGDWQLKFKLMDAGVEKDEAVATTIADFK